MSILYTAINLKIETVKEVAKGIKKEVENNEDSDIEEIILFSSIDFKNDDYQKQIDIYKSEFGEKVIFTYVPLDTNGLSHTEHFVNIFNRKNSSKYIDLSNGQKTTTSQLYFISNLLKIENIYYLSFIEKDSYRYIKIPTLNDVDKLSKVAFFDLIFYIEEVNKIFYDVNENSFLDKIKIDLINGITSFFENIHPYKKLRSAVSDITTFCEPYINILHTFVKNNDFAKNLSNKSRVDFDKYYDKLGELSYFFKFYTNPKENNKRDNDLESLKTIHGLLTSMRVFRNIASHSGNSNHDFQESEVRICINIALECFRCAKLSENFWKELKEYEK